MTAKLLVRNDKESFLEAEVTDSGDLKPTNITVYADSLMDLGSQKHEVFARRYHFSKNPPLTRSSFMTSYWKLARIAAEDANYVIVQKDLEPQRKTTLKGVEFHLDSVITIKLEK